MGSAVGDDGGLVWMGGSKYVYYDGDRGTGQYTYAKARNFTYVKKISGHFDSVFSDMNGGHMYRLTTAASATYSSRSVSDRSTFSHLQCLHANGTVAGDVRLSSSQRMNRNYRVYAGYGYAAFLDYTNNWKVLELNKCARASTVVSLGKNSGTHHSHQSCERGRENGVLENTGGRYSIVYPYSSGRFYRKPIPSGNSVQAFTLGSSFHGDTCSFTLDLHQRRFFWHSEGANSMSEPLFSCPMRVSISATSCSPLTIAPTRTPGINFVLRFCSAFCES